MSQPCVYRDFPSGVVLYRAALLVGTLILGGIVSLEAGGLGLLAYVVVGLTALLWTMSHACRNCAYHGRRCDLGVSLVAARLFPRGGKPAHFPPLARTALKWLGAMLALPIALYAAGLIGVGRRAGPAWLVIYVAMVGIVIATTATSCPHCAMRNICPLSFHRDRRA